MTINLFQVKSLLKFISIPILIQSMGLEEYEVWALVSSILSSIVFTKAGLPVSAAVFISQDLAREDENSLSETLTVVVGEIFILATIAALLLSIEGNFI